MPLFLALTLKIAVLFAMIWIVIRVHERHASNIDGLLVSAIAICVAVAVIVTMVGNLDRGPDRIAQHSRPATVQ